MNALANYFIKHKKMVWQLIKLQTITPDYSKEIWICQKLTKEIQVQRTLAWDLSQNSFGIHGHKKTLNDLLKDL